MTKIFTFFSLFLTLNIYAQYTIITPGNQSANVVTNTTNNGGVELPRLSFSQIQAISNPKAGTVVYDSDVNALRYFNGNRWVITNEQGFSQQISGYFIDEGNAIGFDKSGNLYVAGTFYGTININGVNLTATGSSDIFLAKYNSTGSLVWAVKGGGTEFDKLEALSVSQTGRITITGNYDTSTKFGYYNFNSSGNMDIYVVQYDTYGNVYWATSFGGAEDDRPTDIVNDASGNTYVTGYFNGTMSFANLSSIASAGLMDAFYTKIDNSGNIVWANRFGGVSYDRGNAIVADANGNTYLIGTFQRSASQGNITLTGLNNEDFLFITKIGSDGNISWAKKGGGAYAYTYGKDLVLDNNNNVVVIGHYTGGISFESTNLSGVDVVFLVKYNANGVFQTINTLDSETGSLFPVAMVKDSKDNLFVTGFYQGTVEVNNRTFTANDNDAFVMKISPTGIPSLFQGVGGVGIQSPKGIAVKKDGAIYITGSFASELIFGDINLVSNTADDCFILKVF